MRGSTCELIESAFYFGYLKDILTVVCSYTLIVIDGILKVKHSFIQGDSFSYVHCGGITSENFYAEHECSVRKWCLFVKLTVAAQSLSADAFWRQMQIASGAKTLHRVKS